MIGEKRQEKEERRGERGERKEQRGKRREKRGKRGEKCTSSFVWKLVSLLEGFARSFYI